MGKETDALVSILKDHWARVWDMWQEMIRTIPDSEWAKGDSGYLAPARHVIHTLDCAYVLTGDFSLDRYDPSDTHSRAWQPFLAQRYGNVFAETIIRDARERLESLIPELPCIGGDENPIPATSFAHPPAWPFTRR